MKGRGNGGSPESAGVKVEVAVLGSIVQDLCESRGGRPGLSVLTSLMVYVDVKHHVYFYFSTYNSISSAMRSLLTMQSLLTCYRPSRKS